MKNFALKYLDAEPMIRFATVYDEWATRVGWWYETRN